MKSLTESFYLDFLQDNPAYEELFALLAQHNDAVNLPVIQQLLDVRKILPSTHTETAEASVRLLGINVARDLMGFRSDVFKQLFNVLPQYSDVSGTSQWPKFVSMLLGAQFDSSRLYTMDYQNFVPTPLGVLIQDNGTWYKTTHVDLEVDARLIDSGLDLTIDKDSATEIIAALVAVGMTEAQATDWHTNHIGFDPVNTDPYQKAARNIMFYRRITALFYQWAPIEEVLHGVYSTVNLSAQIYLSAHTVVESVRHSNVGKPLVTELQFIEPDIIHGGESVTFGVNVLFSDSTSRTEEVYVKDHPAIESRDGNSVVFSEPLAIETIDLTVVYGTTEHDISVRLFPLGIEPDPESIEIEKRVLYGSSSSKITVYGLYANGQKRDLTSSGSVILSSSLGTFNGSTLVIPYVAEDTTLVIKATYQGIFDHVDNAQFELRKSEMELVPVSISLQVPDSVTQGTDIPLQCYVTYNDKSSKIVDPQYISTSPNTTIVETTLRSNVLRKDYLTSLNVQYMENEVVVTATKQIKFRAPISILGDLDIIMPNQIFERDIITPKAMALYVAENATHEQIVARDPSIIIAYIEVEAEWFTSSDPDAGLRSLSTLDRITGKFQAPTIADGYASFAINCNVIDGNVIRTFTKLFDIYSTIYVPKIVELLAGTKISSGSFVNLSIGCIWNTGKQAAARANISVEFIPSPSAKLEAYTRTVKLQEEAVANGEDPTQYDPNNPDYTRWVTLNISDSTLNMRDPFLNETAKIKQLYFKGDLHGSARLTISYTYESTTITSVRDLVLIPVRSLVSAVQIECYDTLYEKTRTFVRLFATYADGTQEYVQAANWSASWAGSDDEYKLMQFVPSTYTGMAVVEVLEGKTPANFAEFKSMQASKLPMFLNVGSLDELNNTSYEGAVLQVGKIDTDMAAVIRARFYRIETQMAVTVKIPPVPSINTILSSRIDGSTNITADVQTESYALVCTFQMPGIVKNLDGSYGNIPATTFDAEMTADWFIANHYLMEIDGDTRTLMPSDTPVAVIDSEGNLTPSQNINCAVKLRARYICDGYQIEKFLTVYINQANLYLLGMNILGPENVWDIPERNPTLEYQDGNWYIPYSYRVALNTGIEINGTDGTWTIGDDTTVEGVSIGSPSGFLSISQQQLSEGTIRINCSFVKINPDSAQDETIRASRVIQLHSTRTINEAELSLPSSNIAPNQDFQAVMDYKRFNGVIGSNISPDADSVKFVWTILSSSAGFSLSDTGVFRFAPAEGIQKVTIRCTLKEERTSIDRDIEITCLSTGYPQDLAVTGFVNVRDTSQISLKALLGRSGTFVKEDVSSKCLWQVTNERGDTVTIAGISVNQSGVVNIAALLADTKFGIRCTYIENKVRLTQTHYMTAFCSYPYYGTAPFGIASISSAETLLTNRLRSTVGGTFVLSPKNDEYGYFLCRASYGNAKFAAGSDTQGNVNSAWKGWDGAKWPVTGSDGRTGPIVVTKIYDNVTENMYLYRTNERAFGAAVITVRYE